MKFPFIEPLEARIAPAAVMSISISDPTVTPAIGGTATAVFIISLDHPVPAGDTVTVQYSTHDDTAVSTGATPNFVGIGESTLMFTAGQKTLTVPVTVNGLAAYEADEKFELNITGATLSGPDIPTPISLTENPGTASMVAGSGTGTIHFIAPTVSIASAPTVSDGGISQFLVSLSAPQTHPVTVSYTIVNGTAVAGTDFTAPGSMTVTFQPSETVETIDIPTTIHSAAGPAKNFTVMLANDASLATSPAKTLQETNTVAQAQIQELGLSHFAVNTNSTIVNEAAGTATITVVRSGSLGGPATVDYSTVDGTALAGADYTATQGTLHFNDGQSALTFTVPITSADKHGGSTEFLVQLQHPQPGADDILSGRSQEQVTILDNAPFKSQFSITGTTVDEAAGTVTLTVSRSDTTQAASVDYSTVDGTAVHGIDYSAVPNRSINFGIGDATETITIPLIDAHKTGGNETFNVQLSNPQNAGIVSGSGTAAVTIIQDESVTTFGFGASAISVNEAAGLATLTVTRSGGDLSQAVSVDYQTMDGTAIHGTDYVAATGTRTLQFAPNATTATISIPITEAQKFSGSPQFFVELLNPRNALTNDAVIATGHDKATVTINDSEPAHYGLEASNLTVNETDSTVTFTITRSGNTAVAGTVAYATSDGTATHGIDYSAGNGTLTFAAGVSSETVTIPLINSHKTGGSENFSLQLSNPTNGDIPLGQELETVTITQAAAGTTTFALNSSVATVNEAAGTVSFMVTRSGDDLSQAVSVNYSTVDGTAHSGTDYTSTSGTLKFPAGVSSEIITVPILDAFKFTGTTQFQVALSSPLDNVGTANPSDALITSGHDTATVTINNSDVVPSHFALGASAATVNETDGTVSFTVTRSGDVSGAASIVYATADGTARSGIDYTAGGGTINFAAGAASQTVTIPLIDAHKTGGSENFSIQLSNPQGAILSSGAAGTELVTINQHDTGTTTFALSPLAPGVNETDGAITFTVTRSGGDLSQAVSVDYATVDGTAVHGVDYTTEAGTLHFAAGAATATIAVPIKDAQKFGGSTQFQIELSNPQNPTSNALILSGQDNTTVTINDNDAAATHLAVATTAATVNETDQTVTFTVNRTGDTTGAATVDFMTVDGTAKSGIDYAPTSGVLSFAAGASSAMVTIPLMDAHKTGGSENFSIQLSNPSNADITSGAETVSINQSETGSTIFALNTTAATVNEAAGTVTFTVTRSGDDLSQVVSVNYATVDGTAVQGTDYTAATGTLQFPAHVASESITIPITDAHKLSGSTQFQLELSTPQNNLQSDRPSDALLQSGSDSATVTINDNDAAATHLAVATTAATVNETDQTATFTVSRTGDVSGAATVDYTTVDGTAKAGIDYTQTSGAIQFAAGVASVDVTIPLVDAHKTGGGPENFSIQLSNPSNADITSGTETVSITQNETGSTIFALNTTAATVNEAAGTVTFTVTRSGDDLSHAASVNYATVDGTAVHGIDYTGTSQTLTFPIGAATENITIPITDAHKFGGSTQFQLELSSPLNGSNDALIKSGFDNATVTINDNEVDPGIFAVGKTAATVNETDGTVTFTVTRSGNTSGAASVAYATHDGSATHGIDYTTGGGTIVFPAGAVSETVTIPLIDAHKIGGSEDFSVQLSNPSLNTFIASGSSTETVTINQHDTGTTAFVLGATAQSVNETDGLVTLTVTRSGGDLSQPVSVNYSTLDGTAVQGVDYTSATGTLQFPANVTSETITVPITDAHKFGGNTQFQVALSTPQNPTSDAVIASGQDHATVTIHGNETEPGYLAVSTTAATVNETDGTVTFTVKRTGDTSGAASIDYTTVDGTAKTGIDYTAMSGTIPFAAGETSESVTIPLKDAHKIGGSENFAVQLSNPQGALLSSGSGTETVTINQSDTNNPGATVFALSATTQSVNENAGTVTLTVTRSGDDLSQDVTVHYQTVDGTAVSGTDYTSTSGTVTIAAGSSTATFMVPITDAHKTSGTTQFLVELYNPLNPAGVDLALLTSNQDTATVTITDNDAAVASATHLALSGTSSSVNETGGMISFTVTRSGDTTGASSVSYTTVDGTATHGIDYDAMSGTIDFAAGDTSEIINIPIIDAHKAGGSEQFSVQLSDPQNADISSGLGTGTLSINQNDGGTVFALSSTTANPGEADGTVVLTVTRSGGDISQPASVDYSTRDGSALNGTDYTASTGTVNFPAGQASMHVTINLLDPHRSGGTVAFMVDLSNPVDGVNDALIASGQDHATVTINDNDSATTHLALGTTALTVGESDGTATLTVTRSGDVSGTSTVNYTTSDGTAVQGTDYTAASGTLQFGPNVTSLTIPIPIIDAHKTSGTDQFTVTLSGATHADISAGQGAATVTIDDASHFAFSTPTATVGESDGTATITVTRMGGDLSVPATVDYATMDGTAHSGADYIAKTGTFQFPANVSSMSIPVTVLNTHHTTGTEQFSIQLSNPSNADITAGAGTEVVTIDNVSHFSIASETVDEASGLATLTITRSGGDFTQAASVSYATADGTALHGIDYTASSGTVQFAADANATAESMTIQVPIIDAHKFGGTENFSVQLSNPQHATLLPGQGSATVTINDNDTGATSHFSFDSSSYNVDESKGTVTLTIDRTGDLSGAASVNIMTVDGTAIHGVDYNAVAKTVQFAAGVSTANVTVPINDIHNYGGGTETFLAKLSNAQNADVTVGSDTATVTINDNDVSTFSLGTSPVVFNESAGTVTLTVTRGDSAKGGFATPASVHYATADGATAGRMATAGTDYTAESGTLNFAAGQSTATITIPLANFNYHPGDVDFNVVLSSPQNGTLGMASETVTIHDDAPTPTITIGDASIVKLAGPTGSQNLVFTVKLSNPDNTSDITVHYGTSDGTMAAPYLNATAGIDYTALTDVANNIVTFAKGQTTATISVPIASNNVVNTAVNQDFNLNLSSASFGTVLRATGTGTIIDNFVEKISIANSTAVEGDTESFTVTLSNPSESPVSVHYSTQNGTAIAGTNFTGAADQTVTFAPGITTQTITVPTIADHGTIHPSLVFQVNLNDPSGTGKFQFVTDTATGTITDNDRPSIAINDVQVLPGSSPSQAAFVVTLSAPAKEAVTFFYTTVDGTAVSSGPHPNFVAKSGTITIPTGSSSAEIDIAIDPSSAQTPSEAFTVQLSNVQNAVIATGTGHGTLLANTSSPIGLSIADAQGAEGSGASPGTVTFTATLAAPAPAGGITFIATPTQLQGLGTFGAVAGVDFSAAPLTETIAAGATTVTFSVPLGGNSLFQTNRSFSLDISGVSAGAVALNTTALGTILDDDFSLSHNVLKWHDVDGDTVTMKVSKGVLTGNQVSFNSSGSLGGSILQELNLSGGNGEFRHANVTITAQKAVLFPGAPALLGDGMVNVGFIVGNDDATNVLNTTNDVDLGVITVDGDVARIDAGDTFVDAGLAGLKVHSLGAFPGNLPSGDFNTDAAGNPLPATSTIVGPLTAVHITGNLVGTLQVLGQSFGNLGSLKIDGSLLGSVFFSGRLQNAVIGQIDGSGAVSQSNGAVTGAGVVEGLSSTTATIGSIHVLGSVIGGPVQDTGLIFASHIAKANVGSLIGGAGGETGAVVAQVNIASILVRGSLVGNSSAGAGTVNVNSTLGDLSSGEIVSFGTIGSVAVEGDLMGGSVSRGGSIVAFGAGGIGFVEVDGSLVGGAGINSAEIESHGGIAAVRIGGSIVGSTGTDSGEVNALAGNLGNILVKGAILGGAGQNSASIQVAGQLNSVEIGSAAAFNSDPASINAIVGGAGSNSGWIKANTIGKAVFHGSVEGGAGSAFSGSIQSTGALGSVVIDGGLIGGAGQESGAVESGGALAGISVGSVLGGAGQESGAIHAVGALGKVTIGKPQLASQGLVGGAGNKSGLILAANIGPVVVNGSVTGGSGNASGGIMANGALKSVTITGDLQGGNSVAAVTTDSGFIFGASIGAVVIDGNLTAGLDNGAGLVGSGLINAAGALKSVVVKGSFGQGAIGQPVAYFPDALIAAGGATSGLAIGHVEIDGQINGGQILAGNSAGANGAVALSADAQIGSILIKTAAPISDLNIAAGAAAAPGKSLYTITDVVVSGAGVIDQPKVFSRIASVIFAQNIDPAVMGSSIEAEEIDALSVHGTSAKLVPGPHNDTVGKNAVVQVGGQAGFILFELPDPATT